MAARQNEPVFGAGEAQLEVIRQEVAAYNRQRQPAEWLMYKGIARKFLPFVGIVLAIVVLAQFQGAPGITIITMALAVLIGFGLRRLILKPVADLKERNRERLLPVIYGFIQDFAYTHDEVPDVMPWLQKIDLVPFDTSMHGGTITGRYGGAAFTLTETEMLVEGERQERIVFGGTLFHFRREAFFPGTFVVQAKGRADDEPGEDLFPDGALHDIRSPAAEAGDRYRLRTTNSSAAEALPGGAFGDLAKRLEDAWGGAAWSLVLHDHDCYLLIPVRTGVFDLPAVGRDIDADRDLNPIVAEMCRFMDLITEMRKLR